jgi:hypothetical protein
MFGNLFKKKVPDQAGQSQAPQSQAPTEKLPKPKDILSPIGQRLVTEFNQDPDWVWYLKSVTKPAAEGENRHDFRVFDPREIARQKVVVKNYHHLDSHPELILYHGWVNTKRNEVEIHDTRAEIKKAG